MKTGTIPRCTNPSGEARPSFVSGPKPSRILDETIEDPALYGLDPVATTVEVTDRSGQMVMFELGAVTPDGSNQYVRLNDGSLSTLPKIWGEVVVSLATAPPYSPPLHLLVRQRRGERDQDTRPRRDRKDRSRSRLPADWAVRGGRRRTGRVDTR